MLILRAGHLPGVPINGPGITDACLKNSHSLIITINTSILLYPPDFPYDGETPCWNFQLIAYSWTHPYWPLMVCTMNTTNNQVYLGENTVNSITAISTNNTAHLSIAQLFTFEVGSQVDNEWLRLTQDAAKDMHQDCIVCLGARPSLTVAPFVKDNITYSHCISQVMSQDNPTSNCSWVDSPHLVTNAYDRPPQFKIQTPFKFTCFHSNNKAVDTISVGSVHSSVCHTIATHNNSYCS